MTGASRFRLWRGDRGKWRRTFAGAALAGLLVASPGMAGAGASTADPSRVELVRLIHDIAACVGISPYFAESVARAESSLDLYAISPNGCCRGLFQLHHRTAREMGVHERDIFDAVTNTAAGLRYLRRQLEDFGHIGIGLALVAYQAGPAVARRWTRDPATPIGLQTRQYVSRVIAIFERLRRGESAPRAPSPEICSALLTQRMD